jgi:alpha-tubulin suppressor-like RCC1 family protein
LGNGTNVTAPIPVQVNNLTSVVGVSAGQYHSLFLKNDGTAWGVGYNAYGQLGNNSTLNRSSPVTLVSPFNVTSWSSVTTGTSNTAAIRNDGGLYAWGNGLIGQLGITPILNSFTLPNIALPAAFL